MMGLICNLLLDMAESRAGPDAPERILREAGLPGRTFKSELIYPEEDWQQLATAAAELLGVDADAAERAFAEHVLPVLEERFGAFFRSSGGAMALLRKVPKIHLDFPRAMGAETEEKLMILADEDQRLVYRYCSPNQLCTFLVALAEQVMVHYGEVGWRIEQTQCMKDGAPFCEIAFTVPQSETHGHPSSRP